MEEALIKRIMPNSLEAEQSVVGSMIMSKDAIVTASEMLLKEDFYHQQYGIIFETMVELFTEGQPVDLVTLQNRLKEKDVPQEIQSLDFVRTLVTSVPTSANIKYYANIVKENAIKRKLIHVTEDIENECYAGKESLESVLDKTEHDVFELLSTRQTGDYVPIRTVVMNALEKIEKAAQQEGADRLHRLRLQDSRTSAVRSRARGSPSVNGKDSLRAQHSTACGISRTSVYSHILTRDVEGTARKPSVLTRIKGRCAGTAYRKSV